MRPKWIDCLWVSNHGSSGFTVEFDVSKPSEGKEFHVFHLIKDGSIVDHERAPSATLESNYCDWLSIPGFDGGPPLPYSGYLHSIEFTINGEETPFRCWSCLPDVIADVDVSLYVVLNSKGALYSMTAWASDSGGDGYEVSVLHSSVGKRLRWLSCWWSLPLSASWRPFRCLLCLAQRRPPSAPIAPTICGKLRWRLICTPPIRRLPAAIIR